MDTHRYILEPYHGSSSRHVCPSCGQREFTYFIDVTTSQPLSPKCGRCNRESNCGYCYSPKDFFADNLDARPEQSEWKEPVKVEQKPISFLPNTILTDIQPCRDRNALHRYLCTVFHEQEVNAVFEKYHVGTTRDWRCETYYSCAFPQIDMQGRICQLKVIGYNPTNGKRLHKQHQCEQWDKRLKAYVKAPDNADRLLFLGKRLMGKDKVFQQTFFGCHLIPQANLIGLCESEKTCLIASMAMPFYTWIGTGGAQGCRFTEPHQAKLLQGKKVVLFPDEDKMELWEQKAEQLRKQGIDASVCKICKDKGSHFDIGDLIIENRLSMKKPDYKWQTIGELCEELRGITFAKGQCKINV